MNQMRCQTAERHLTARSRAGNRLMTEKVCLAAIKRTQYSCFPLRLCAKKANPKRRTLSRSSCPQTRSKEPEQHRGEKVYARKRLSFAHKTRIKPAAERGGKWHKMAQNAVVCGGLWRILSQCVADYGGLCRSVWRNMADFVVSMWRNMADFVVSMWRIMAQNGGLCHSMAR